MPPGRSTAAATSVTNPVAVNTTTVILVRSRIRHPPQQDDTHLWPRERVLRSFASPSVSIANDVPPRRVPESDAKLSNPHRVREPVVVLTRSLTGGV